MRRDGIIHGWVRIGDSWTNSKGRRDNHSKFTSVCSRAKCRHCRLHPVEKAKSKTKGMLKHNVYIQDIRDAIDDRK